MSGMDKNLEDEIDFLDFCISQTKEDIEMSKEGKYRFTHPGLLKMTAGQYDKFISDRTKYEAKKMLEEFAKINQEPEVFAEYLGRVLELEQRVITTMKVSQRYVFDSDEPEFKNALAEECKKYSQYLQVKDPEKFERQKEDRQKLEYLLSKAEPGKEPELRKFLEKVYEGYQDPQYEYVNKCIADKKTGLIFTVGRFSGYSTVYRKKGEEYTRMNQPVVLDLQIAQLFKVEPEALATPEARKNIKLDKPIERREIGCIHHSQEDKDRCESGSYSDSSWYFEDPGKLVQKFYPERSWRTYGGYNPSMLIMVDFDKGRLDTKYKEN